MSSKKSLSTCFIVIICSSKISTCPFIATLLVINFISGLHWMFFFFLTICLCLTCVTQAKINFYLHTICASAHICACLHIYTCTRTHKSPHTARTSVKNHKELNTVAVLIAIRLNGFLSKIDVMHSRMDTCLYVQISMCVPMLEISKTTANKHTYINIYIFNI